MAPRTRSTKNQLCLAILPMRDDFTRSYPYYIAGQTGNRDRGAQTVRSRSVIAVTFSAFFRPVLQVAKLCSRCIVLLQVVGQLKASNRALQLVRKMC